MIIVRAYDEELVLNCTDIQAMVILKVIHDLFKTLNDYELGYFKDPS